jgi:hypothetical protein
MWRVRLGLAFRPTLARRRSTTEPRPPEQQIEELRYRPDLSAESAESQNRTGDTAIFSRVLYQLSYLGLKVDVKILAQTRHYSNRA